MKEPVTVAIVDDNATYCKLLMKTLQFAGVSVIFYADDGVECLLKMETSIVLPNILLIDIEMPIMNGFDTARHLKLRWPQIKIIAHSSVNDIRSITRAICCGADIFLSKNCSATELISVIEYFQFD